MKWFLERWRHLVRSLGGGRTRERRLLRQRKEERRAAKRVRKDGDPAAASLPRALLRALFWPGEFWRGGLAAAREAAEPLILHPRYRAPLRRSLGEYLSSYHRKEFLHGIRWMGIPTMKLVSDYWIYQEVIHETRPEVIIEIGSYQGGTTLFLAHMLDLLGGGAVVSIDRSREMYRVSHPRITTVTGDCSAAEVVERARELSRGKRTMVIHDADHAEEAVLRDLRLYGPLVTPGQFLIVEDGVVDLFNPRRRRLSDLERGPLPAVERYLAENPGLFEVVEECERFVLTSNPRGYLRKLR